MCQFTYSIWFTSCGTISFFFFGGIFYTANIKFAVNLKNSKKKPFSRSIRFWARDTFDNLHAGIEYSIDQTIIANFAWNPLPCPNENLRIKHWLHFFFEIPIFMRYYAPEVSHFWTRQFSFGGYWWTISLHKILSHFWKHIA